MNPEHQIANARVILGQINALAEIGFDLAERMVTAEGREALVRELGPAALELLGGASPQQVVSRVVSRSITTRGAFETGEPEFLEDQSLESIEPTSELTLLPSQAMDRSEGIGYIGVASTLGSTALRSTPIMLGAKLVTEALQDMHNTAELETTKRTGILAERDETIARIEATRRAMELYLNRTFDERRENFSRLFEVLDRAQEKDDPVGMQMALSGILELVKSSPFKDFDSFKKSFDNPDHEWEF